MKQIKRIAVVLMVSTLCCSNNQVNGQNIKYRAMKWNFKNFKTLTYKYVQKMTMNNSFLSDLKEQSKNTTEISCLLIVESISDNEANITFTKVNMLNFELDSLGKHVNEKNKKLPNILIIEGLQEDGQVNGAYNPEFVFFSKMLFPILNKQIKFNNTYTLPLKVPFDVAGVVVYTKGNNKVTYVSTDNGINQLESIINVSEYDLPNKNSDDYANSIIGKSSFSFNSEKGFFTKGQIGFTLQIGKKESIDMNMDVNINLELITIEH